LLLWLAARRRRVRRVSAAAERPDARLCLVRHGQGSLGTADYDRLSELGQRQAVLLGERIGADYAGQAWQVWSGSLKRHRQTLAGLAPDREGRIEPA
jgi:broad specificity phosphatase PhoE